MADPADLESTSVNPPDATAPDVAPNDEDDDSFMDESVLSTASLSSSILRYPVENNRTYHAYKSGKYQLPNDESESERLDVQHKLVKLVLQGMKFGYDLAVFDEDSADLLHFAPLENLPPGSVLDVGCGTGIWTCDFGDHHPDRRVIGVDLSPIQPSWTPPNAEFCVDDVTENWTWKSGCFAFIFIRFLTGSISDWPALFREAYKSLAPGGMIEIQDVIYPLTCDDKSLNGTELLGWSEKLTAKFASLGIPIDSALKYPEQLKEVGFVGITEGTSKLPTNTWPKTLYWKQVGAFNYASMDAGLEAFTLAPFTRKSSNGSTSQDGTMTREEVLLWTARVRNDLKRTRIHGFVRFNAIYATKPK